MIHSLGSSFSQIAVFLSGCFTLLSFLYGIVKLFAVDHPVKPWREQLREANEKYWYEVEDREIRFERFTAWTECPKCLTLDLHRIKDTLPHSCRRQCSKCKYVWRQI